MVERKVKETSKAIINASGKYLNDEKAFDYWFKKVGNRDSLLLLGCEMLVNNDIDGLTLIDAYSMECHITGDNTCFTEFLVFSGYGAQFLQKEKGEIEKSVYVIELDGTSVKIGVSQDTEKRFKQISHGSGMNITKSFVSERTKDAFKIEKALHNKFEDLRKDNGEFFNVEFDEAVRNLQNMLENLESA